MWAEMCANLSEILDVRGSNLTEDEAWILLYEIGRQLKNVPTETSQNYVIIPENIQLHQNGGLSINFCHKNDENAYKFSAEAHKNVLVYSLGMTVLYCLQRNIPKERFLDISEDLQSVLSMMTSPNFSSDKLEEFVNHQKLSPEEWENSVLNCFKDMYKTIFGSASDIRVGHGRVEVLSDELASPNGIADDCPRMEKMQPLVKYSHPQYHNAQVTNSISFGQGDANYKDNVLHGIHDGSFRAQDDAFHVNHGGNFVSRGSNNFMPYQNAPFEQNFTPEKGHVPTSMLHSKESPTQISLTMKRSNFNNISQVTVEYLDGRKLLVNLEMDRLLCGHLQSVAISHFKVDPTAFHLTLLNDGEYIFMDPSSKISDLAVMSPDNLQFSLRLKFIPQDLNSVTDLKVLQALYLQTRRDLLDGFISCNTEEALLLSAYSLQYELGDIQYLQKPFRMRDYVPCSILERHGTSYLRTSLVCLHLKMQGTLRSAARNMYLRKAMELPDYGTHLLHVFLGRKCHPSSSAWISVGPRGFNLFQCHGDSRTMVQSFSWDDLMKISYKKTTVILAARSKLKIKFYVKKEQRSKYIIKLIGETHQFHRFTDFRSVDQYYYPMTTPVIQPPHIFPRHQPPHSMNEIHYPDNQHPPRINEPNDMAPQQSLPESEVSSSHPEITPYDDNDGGGHFRFEKIQTGSITKDKQPDRASDRRTRPKSATSHNPSNVTVRASVHRASNSFSTPREPFNMSDVPPPILTDLREQTLHDGNDTHHLQIPAMVEHATEGYASSSFLSDTDVSIEHERPVFTISDASDDSSEVDQLIPISSTIDPATQFDPSYDNLSSRACVHKNQSDLRDDYPSRGEGDGISNISGLDQQSDHSRNTRSTVKSTQQPVPDVIPEAISSTIADFEEFKRRLSRLKSANESSSDSEDNETWSGVRT